VLDPNESPGQETISGTLQNFSQFTTFVDVLEEAQMLGDLDVSQTFTVLAPNNDALSALFDAQGITDNNGNGSRADEFVDAVGDSEATDILYYHVLDGVTVYADDISENNYYETGSNAAPGGNPLSLLLGTDESGQTPEVNGGSDTGAEILSADILATNGIIHEIDAALALPTVADLVAANNDLSSLTNALQETNLTGTLSDSESTYTVFAPTNDAFAAIVNTYNGLSNDQKADVLTYHVLTDQVTSSEITEGPVTTLNGQTINFSISGAGVSITDSDGGTSQVITTDVQGTNGIVHLISDVLLPSL
jgi:transforming growth factor-beta-induced protein